MDPQRFDRLTRTLGLHLSRRAALHAGAGLGGLALSHSEISAQEATPATPAASTAKTVRSLFVQSFEGGSLSPKPGEPGAFVLALHGEHGRTIAFSDRPERVVASAPTQSFLDALGFSPANPPNAALVFEPSPGDTDVIVVELLNPQYDDATQQLTYAVRVLEGFAEAGLSVQELPRQPKPSGEAFGIADLFIDDCPDETLQCYDANNPGTILGTMTVGRCYQVWPPSCNLCENACISCNSGSGHPAGCTGQCCGNCENNPGCCAMSC